MYWWACSTISHLVLFTGRLTLSHFSLDPWEKNQQCLFIQERENDMTGWKDWKDFEKPAASLLPHDSKGRSQSDTWTTFLKMSYVIRFFWMVLSLTGFLQGARGAIQGPSGFFQESKMPIRLFSVSLCPGDSFLARSSSILPPGIYLPRYIYFVSIYSSRFIWFARRHLLLS